MTKIFFVLANDSLDIINLLYFFKIILKYKLHIQKSFPQLFKLFLNILHKLLQIFPKLFIIFLSIFQYIYKIFVKTKIDEKINKLKNFYIILHIEIMYDVI